MPSWSGGVRKRHAESLVAAQKFIELHLELRRKLLLCDVSVLEDLAGVYCASHLCRYNEVQRSAQLRGASGVAPEPRRDPSASWRSVNSTEVGGRTTTGTTDLTAPFPHHRPPHQSRVQISNPDKHRIGKHWTRGFKSRVFLPFSLYIFILWKK